MLAIIFKIPFNEISSYTKLNEKKGYLGNKNNFFITSRKLNEFSL